MVNVRLVSAALGAACLFAACVQSMNPCPAGSTGSDTEDRCVDMSAVEADAGDGGDPMEDAGDVPAVPVPDPVSKDASVLDAEVDEPIDAGGDASEPLDGGDAGEEPDAGEELDAGGAGDAGVTDDDAGTQCGSDDVAAWKAFHLAEGLVAQIMTCAASPSCADGECPLDACVREAAGVAGCSECVAAEVACVVRECATPCGVRGSDDACRACACESGCVNAFGECAATPVEDVCADCSDGTCENMSVLPPELIMAVLHPVLLAPAMMP
jgi:hypothetical protein